MTTREIVQQVAAWQGAGTDCALATIVCANGSTPRPVGTVMAVSRDGAVAGSISVGCVESDLFHAAAEVMDTGRPVVRRYAVGDDEFGGAGLMCGGSMAVLVQPAGPGALPGLALAADAVAAGLPVALGTVVSSGPRLGGTVVVTADSCAGSCGDRILDAAVVARARACLDAGAATVCLDGRGGQSEIVLSVLISSIIPPPRMLVFGAMDFAHALTRAAKALGYSVTLCDARPVFATAERFPEADDVVVMWPHRYLGQATIGPTTAICVLTHDPRFDVPALAIALRSGAGYVGAMGSRRSHLDRVDRLRAAGVTDAELARLSAPIGLDLGARTPEETAVSILAEIIALRRGGSGRRLAGLTGPIHDRSAP
ncbi:XdhC family protein [Rhodococcus kronopolitis]|uniref:XdhC family protein n=1 Tax=Rhodococcus kronopolitis TaxID=1460226 RepID=A0ABV9FRI9_9NOCA